MTTSSVNKSSSATTSSATPEEQHTVELPTVPQLLIRIADLQTRIEALETVTKPVSKEQKEMTDADALAIITGEHAKLTHNKAAQALGLSYGQVYSCRGEYTFRHIWKQIRAADPRFTNPWKK
jgi:hypothetical protein